LYEFDADTAVEKIADGRYRAEITDRWNTFAGPNGGYILAIAARALSDALPMPHPLTITGHFLRPPKPGPAEVRTELIKAGRRHATGAATLSSEGTDILTAVATYADLTTASGRTVLFNEPPALPDADSLPDPLGAIPPGIELPSIAKRIEVRVPELPGFLKGKPSGDPSAEMWVRFADGRPQDPLSLVFFVDGAAFPAVVEIGEFVSSTVELTVHVRALPAEGWLACRIRTRHVESGYAEEDFEIWDARGSLAAQSRQLILIQS
jgi:acyl-CoA thioesterase